MTTSKDLSNLSFLVFTNRGRRYVRAYRNVWIPQVLDKKGKVLKAGYSKPKEQHQVGALLDNNRVLVSEKFTNKFPQFLGCDWYFYNRQLVDEETYDKITASQIPSETPQEGSDKAATESTQADSEDTDVPEPTSKSFLPYFALSNLARKCGITNSLTSVFGKKAGKQFLDYALYLLLTSGSADCYEDWAFHQLLSAESEPMNGRDISKLLQLCTDEAWDKFWKERYEHSKAVHASPMSEKVVRFCAFDSTSISTYSAMDDAAFGHAMDDSTNQTRYLGMNLNKAPFNDPLVREAVSYAVNQQELETSVFDGLETAAETLFTNEKPNCGVEVKTYPTDMEKAKQLMKEAGYEDTNDDGILEKDGTSLAIHFNYSQSLASVDNAVLSIAASLKELGFDVTIDAVDMNTWYGALMAGEYDLTFYNTAGGSFDPATDMSNMAPGAMGDPILCQFSAFFENPEIFAELDSTSDSQRVQEIYGMILNGIADQNLLVPVTGTHDLALWNTDKITGYDFYTDASYVDIASVHVK